MANPSTTAELEVTGREQLIYLLTEAAELEHGLMCSYLFAAFSLKREAEELTDAERTAIDRWRASIHAVAMEEMLHLCLVQNLLLAIGAAPHMQRPNFPIPAGLYPSGLSIELARFSSETIEHFVFLERPEDAALSDVAQDTPDYERAPRIAGLTPSARDYETVGALYEGITRGFEQLARRLGHDQLFVGDLSAQVDRTLVNLEGLEAVTDLDGVRRAVARIVEQGEGGRRTRDDSHFVRFQTIERELTELRRARPMFDPAHPVVTNPVMNAPADSTQCCHIEEPHAALVLDLANAAYGLMVQLLACFFCADGRGAERKRWIDAAILLMTTAVAPLSAHLATLPAATNTAMNAGMSFTLPRSMHALPRSAAALVLLRERATALADACKQAGGALTGIGTRLSPLLALLRGPHPAA